MELSPGQDADITGEVRSRRAIPRQGGSDFVKAQLVLAEGDPVTVMWWDAGLAPPEGQRIRVKGRAGEYSGELEVHAEETVVDRSRPPANSMAQVVGFWMGCVETEAAGSLQIWLKSRRHLEFARGPHPLLAPCQLLRGSDAARWRQHRSMAVGEAVVAGWPLVIGIDRDNSSSRPVGSPLLSTEIRLSRTDDGWSVEPDGPGVDFNPYALDLLGIGREQRDEMTQLVESSPEVEEAGNSAERAAAILSVVAEAGVDGLAELNPSGLAEHGSRPGIHGTGALMVPAGSPRITRMLRDGLQELLNDPAPLMKGPAAVLLGRSRAPKAPFPKPHPTVVDSSLAQDRAVTAAMEKSFTVLPAHPGPASHRSWSLSSLPRLPERSPSSLHRTTIRQSMSCSNDFGRPRRTLASCGPGPLARGPRWPAKLGKFSIVRPKTRFPQGNRHSCRNASSQFTMSSGIALIALVSCSA